MEARRGNWSVTKISIPDSQGSAAADDTAKRWTYFRNETPTSMWQKYGFKLSRPTGVPLHWDPALGSIFAQFNEQLLDFTMRCL